MNRSFKVGIDNYSLKPLHLNPLEILKWAEDNGAEGVSFSKIPPDQSDIVDKSYLKELSQYAGEHDLYLEWGGAEHIPRDLNSWRIKDIFKINQQVAEQAAILDVRIVRSCSGGLMRWNDSSPMTETLLRETAAALLAQKQMLNDHNVILAIETHFEFTTHELLRLFEMCDAEPGSWLGI
ncbi:TIM barrel protein, partial [candidate division KSB1 bacterium]|nr:TIM barrel protein [candidate division KSB1 bacterium]